MLEDFQKHINSQFSFLGSSRLLLAVSGGLDSMVLVHLCQNAGYDIAVAHCNFNLRGEESDADTTFVKNFCDEYKITCYTQSFETKKYASAKGISTQMAARDLRYEWFESLLEEESFEYLFTAHHLNDDLETFLINFSRGTGLKGLTGIPDVNGKAVRPLLEFSRKRIHQYAIETNIKWREDASNASDDYVRNHLRHHAIPSLENANSNLIQGFKKTKSYLKQSENLLKVYDEQLRQQYTYPINSIQGKSGLVINLKTLENHPESEAVLNRLLSGYGFNNWEDIYGLQRAQSGKQALSKTHRLVRSRGTFELYELEEKEDQYFSIAKGETRVSGPFGTITIDTPTTLGVGTRNSLVVPTYLLEFPLTIRKWERGDFFYPFGMGGKKKLGKYFKDEKLSLIDKENVWLLCSKGAIIWVINHRSDDRYKVTDTSQKMTRLTVTYETKNS